MSSLLPLALCAATAALALPVSAPAQEYAWPDDPEVRAKLERWQDLKSGLMMHWGTYSQWEIVLQGLQPTAGSSVRSLESGKELSWTVREGRTRIEVPEDIRDSSRSRHAWVIELERVESGAVR